MQTSTHIVLTFASFIANLSLGLVILSINPKNRLNRIYAVFAFAVTWWSLMKLGQASSDTPERAFLFYQLSAPGWCLLPAVYIHFVAVFIKKNIPVGSRYSIHAMYAICIIFTILLWPRGAMLQGMIRETWGFTHVPGPFYRYAFQPFFLISFIYATIELIRFAHRTKIPAEKARAVLLTAGTMVPLVGGAITNMVLPSFDVHVIELALPLTTVNAAIIAFAMIKYKFLAITVEYAASTIINTMGDSLIVLDLDGKIILVNPATMELLRYKNDRLMSRHINEIAGDNIFSEKFLSDINQKGIVKAEVQYVDRSGENIPTSMSVASLKDGHESTVGYVCVAKDIREIKNLIYQIEEAKKELEKLSVTDPLTGLSNRRLLMIKLKEEYLRAKRYSKPFSIAMIDLDRFKEINDRFGHGEGDKVLQVMAEGIKANVRGTDTVGRYGGDEFAVLLPETDKESAIRMAERIRTNLPYDKLPEEYRFVTISLGISTFSPESEHPGREQLLKLSDNALYRAKKLGRNRVCHSDEMDEEDMISSPPSVPPTPLG